MDWLADPETWAALAALTTLEIVLGADNLVFLAVLASRLPPERQAAARRLGLAVALVTRLVLLASIVWLAKLTTPLFDLLGHGFSGRDLILAAGGFYLVYSGTREIHANIEGSDEAHHAAPGASARSFAAVVLQIGLLDIVFSLDSVITAVGMANQFWIMATAIVIAVAVMLLLATPVSEFIGRHPTVKMLAFSFLLLIGTTLVADGFGFHVPRGYIYAAIGFSIAVETLNQLAAQRRRSARRPTAPSPAPRSLRD
jgi:predicted tellurium resistance membrane protein TerC